MTRVVVLIGVSGSGKTTVGQALAEALGWAFEDADDYHDASSIRKISRGQPLTDADRRPWLERLGALVRDRAESGPPTVLACSALKASYRNNLEVARPDVEVAWLDVPRDDLERRLRSRQGHFAGADLLESQLETFEAPGGDVVRLDGRRSIERLVTDALHALEVAA